MSSREDPSALEEAEVVHRKVYSLALEDCFWSGKALGRRYVHPSRKERHWRGRCEVVGASYGPKLSVK